MEHHANGPHPQSQSPVESAVAVEQYFATGGGVGEGIDGEYTVPVRDSGDDNCIGIRIGTTHLNTGNDHSSRANSNGNGSGIARDWGDGSGGNSSGRGRKMRRRFSTRSSWNAVEIGLVFTLVAMVGLLCISVQNFVKLSSPLPSGGDNSRGDSDLRAGASAWNTGIAIDEQPKNENESIYVEVIQRQQQQQQDVGQQEDDEYHQNEEEENIQRQDNLKDGVAAWYSSLIGKPFLKLSSSLPSRGDSSRGNNDLSAGAVPWNTSFATEEQAKKENENVYAEVLQRQKKQQEEREQQHEEGQNRKEQQEEDILEQEDVNDGVTAEYSSAMGNTKDAPPAAGGLISNAADVVMTDHHNALTRPIVPPEGLEINGTSHCDDLITNGDFSEGDSGWDVLGYSAQSRIMEDGTLAIFHREHWGEGISQFLDTACLLEGHKFEVHAIVRLADSGGTVECNPEQTELKSHSCPVISLHVVRGDGISFHQEIGHFVSPNNQYNFKRMYGEFTVTKEMEQADSVLLYINKADTGVKIIIDKIEVLAH